jgi:hypothetical protein
MTSTTLGALNTATRPTTVRAGEPWSRSLVLLITARLPPLIRPARQDGIICDLDVGTGLTCVDRPVRPE